MSETVLRAIGYDYVTVQGLPWCRDPKVLSAAAFSSRVLCERHNNALSFLDAEAGRMHRLWFAVEQGHREDRPIENEVDMTIMERWFVKVAINFTVSSNMPGMARWGEEGPELPGIPDSIVHAVYGSLPFPKYMGLYYVVDPGPPPPEGFHLTWVLRDDTIVGVYFRTCRTKYFVSLYNEPIGIFPPFIKVMPKEWRGALLKASDCVIL